MRPLKIVCSAAAIGLMVATPIARLTSSAEAQGGPGLTGHATVTDLGGLAGCVGGHIAAAINASGTAVGWASRDYAGGPCLVHEVAVTFDPPPPSAVYDPNGPYDISEVAVRATSINDAGIIVGGGIHGYIASAYAGPGGWLPPLPGGIATWVAGDGGGGGGHINNAGEVLGTTSFDYPANTDVHPTLWVGGSPIDLGTFNGLTPQPMSLAPNRHGSDLLIVGFYYPPPTVDPTPVIWRNGVWSQMAGVPNCNRNYATPTDVSDDGMVVGVADWCVPGQGVLWENADGPFRTLNTECQLAYGSDTVLAGSFRAIALTPGGRHLIVGTCGPNQPAVFYDDGRGNYTAELLPLLTGDTEGFPLDVNPSGQIVGWTGSPGVSHAVRWDFSIPNLAPVAQAGGFTTDEDTAFSGTLVASDIDGDALIYSIVDNGSKGTATLTNAATGAFTYTPNANENGTDAFTFKVNDGTVDSNVATVSVEITPVNDPPVASDGTASVKDGTSVTGTLVASDIDSPNLTYVIVTNGSKGVATITDAGTGAYMYAANAGSSGTDTFTFKANDGFLDSNVATLVATIYNCASDISGSATVTKGPLKLNKRTGRYTQSVTLRNGGGPISGPVSLVLDNLSSNATPFAAGGATTCTTPTGSPYVDVDVGTDAVFSSRERATVTLEFVNPSGQAVTYTTRVLAGAGNR